jgi:hypothetical protein
MKEQDEKAPYFFRTHSDESKALQNLATAATNKKTT